MARSTRRGRALLSIAIAVLAGPALLAGTAGAVEQIGDCVADVADDALAEAGVEPGTEEARLIIEGIEDDAYEDCLDAPNPLLPDMNELIWGAIGFFIVFGFIWKFGMPAIKSGMQARADRIQGDLDAASSQREEADQILSEYRAQLADAKNESARIIEEARQSADALKREQEARLQAELAEMRNRAQADIETAKTNAIADLRGEVAALAVGAAEIVVQRNLDQSAQTELVESYIDSVAQQRS